MWILLRVELCSCKHRYLEWKRNSHIHVVHLRQVSDVDNVLGLLQTEVVQIHAEAYDVALDMTFPKGIALPAVTRVRFVYLFRNIFSPWQVAFRTMTLLVGHQEEWWDVGIIICLERMVCRCGHRVSTWACPHSLSCLVLSWVRCRIRLFAYGPDEATDIQKPHYLFASLKSERFYLSGICLLCCPGKEAINSGVCFDHWQYGWNELELGLSGTSLWCHSIVANFYVKCSCCRGLCDAARSDVMLWLIGAYGGIDFDAVRVYEECKQSCMVKNKGKYDISYSYVTGMCCHCCRLHTHTHCTVHSIACLIAYALTCCMQ